MDVDAYTQALVADYLGSQGYTDTLRSFQNDVGRTVQSNDLEPLQNIVKAHYEFLLHRDASVGEAQAPFTTQQVNLIQSEKIKVPGWTTTEVTTSEASTLSSLVVYSSFARLQVAGSLKPCGLFSSNDKALTMIDLSSGDTILKQKLFGSSVGCKIVMGIEGTDLLLLCGMNGVLAVARLSQTGSELFIISTLQLHKRVVTSMRYLPIDEKSGFIASIGWDFNVNLTKLEMGKEIKLEMIDSYKLLTNATCLEFFHHQNLPVVLVGRQGVSSLTAFVVSVSRQKLVELCKFSLDDSEFSSHSFQPMTITSHSDHAGHTLVSVGTDHVPYMRLITVAVPDLDKVVNDIYASENDGDEPIDDKLSRLNLLEVKQQSYSTLVPTVRNMIVSSINSMSPQDKYSAPLIKSREVSGCSGIWVAGDDGVMRGIDLSEGKSVTEFKCHEGRIKTFLLGKHDGEVIMTFGAIDKKMVRSEGKLEI